MIGRREQLLQAAARLFVTRGYAATSMSDIARTLDLTKGALAYHFPNKESVLSAILQSADGTFTDAEKFVDILPSPSSLHRIILLQLALGAIVQKDVLLQAAITLAGDPSVPPERTATILDEFCSMVERSLQRARTEGLIDTTMSERTCAEFIAVTLLGYGRYGPRLFRNTETRLRIEEPMMRGLGIENPRLIIDESIELWSKYSTMPARYGILLRTANEQATSKS